MTTSLQAIREQVVGRARRFEIGGDYLTKGDVYVRLSVADYQTLIGLFAKLELAMAWMNHKSNCALAHRGLVIDVDCCTCGLDAALKEINGE